MNYYWLAVFIADAERYFTCYRSQVLSVFDTCAIQNRRFNVSAERDPCKSVVYYYYYYNI